MELEDIEALRAEVYRLRMKLKAHEKKMDELIEQFGLEDEED